MHVETVIVAADHGGFALKEQLRAALDQSCIDVGAYSLLPEDDYPEYAHRAARELQAQSGGVLEDPSAVVVLLCRTGAGMAIVANRYAGVRAVECRSPEEARVARAKNNANALVLSADVLDFAQAWSILQTFVQTPFAGGRHARRVEAIEDIL